MGNILVQVNVESCCSHVIAGTIKVRIEHWRGTVDIHSIILPYVFI